MAQGQGKIILFATIGGFIGALISGILPSIATQYWMWKERQKYRWVLIVSWIIVIVILILTYWYFKKQKGG
jgi:MFS family permease